MEAFDEKYNEIYAQKKSLAYIYRISIAVVVLTIIITMHFNGAYILGNYVRNYIIGTGVVATTALIVYLWQVYALPHFDMLFLVESQAEGMEKIRQSLHVFFRGRRVLLFLTYVVATAYLGSGTIILAIGYVSRSFTELMLSAFIFAIGFYLLVTFKAIFDTLSYVNVIDLSERPRLRKVIESGILLLPRSVNIGSCNIYMRIKLSRCISKFQGVKNTRSYLRVTLEAAGLKAAGTKTRHQPTPYKRTWEEIWNCAFLSSGSYSIN